MDFLSSNDASLAGVRDPDPLPLAAEQDRILVSHDFQTWPRHFADFLQARGFQPRPDPRASVLVNWRSQELVLIWGATDADEWRTRVVRIP